MPLLLADDLPNAAGADCEGVILSRDKIEAESCKLGA